jgi:hypothetical protein
MDLSAASQVLDCADTAMQYADMEATLGIALWDDVGARLGCAEPRCVPELPELISAPFPHT